MWINVLYVLQILVCASLILLVVTADKEEGGLSGAIGGGGGGRGRYKPGYEEQRDKLTQYVAWTFVAVSLLIAAFHQ